jgi:uncharacterized membrane protein YkvA (DUF1232 family)
MVPSRHEQKVKHGFWPKLARVLARVPFAEDAIAAYYCAFDPATPVQVRGILLAALGYFILPFDTLPDFILGLGFTDDMAVLFTAISLIHNHMTPAHRNRARAALEKLRNGEAVSA